MTKVCSFIPPLVSVHIFARDTSDDTIKGVSDQGKYII